MWTEENINSAASTHVANTIHNRYLSGIGNSKVIKYFIREAFIAGAKYVIDNTQKTK